MATYQADNKQVVSDATDELRFAQGALSLGRTAPLGREMVQFALGSVHPTRSVEGLDAVTPGAHQMERITNRLTAEPASTADANKDYSGRTSSRPGWKTHEENHHCPCRCLHGGCRGRCGRTPGRPPESRHV